MKKISKKEIKHEKIVFDGTCPFGYGGECSRLSYKECNKCEVSFVYRDNKDSLFNKLDYWSFEHLPLFIYKIPEYIKNLRYTIEFFLQKIFRKNHLADKEIWNTSYYLTKFFYPRIKAFIDFKRQGFPAIFSEYDEHSGFESKEQYDSLIKSGKMLGGGMEAWNKILNEILFAFEYTYHEETGKVKNFYKKWELEDPYEEKESNRHESFIKDTYVYFNLDLARKYEERASEGFKLFGQYIQNLWD